MIDEWKKHEIRLVKDLKKSYYYVYDGDECIGIFMWHFKKKKYVFDSLDDKKE